jgi:hypothetical protein
MYEKRKTSVGASSLAAVGASVAVLGCKELQCTTVGATYTPFSLHWATPVSRGSDREALR